MEEEDEEVGKEDAQKKEDPSLIHQGLTKITWVEIEFILKLPFLKLFSSSSRPFLQLLI